MFEQLIRLLDRYIQRFEKHQKLIQQISLLDARLREVELIQQGTEILMDILNEK